MKYKNEDLKVLEEILIDAYKGVINMKLFDIVKKYGLSESQLISDLLFWAYESDLDAKIFNCIYKKIGVESSDIFKEYTRLCFE